MTVDRNLSICLSRFHAFPYALVHHWASIWTSTNGKLLVYILFLEGTTHTHTQKERPIYIYQTAIEKLLFSARLFIVHTVFKFFFLINIYQNKSHKVLKRCTNHPSLSCASLTMEFGKHLCLRVAASFQDGLPRDPHSRPSHLVYSPPR